MEQEDVFKKILQANEERITSPRLMIFRALLRKAPLTRMQLARLLNNDGIDTATTYRNLWLLRRLKIIDDTIINGHRLIDEFKSHHHHFFCTSCNKLIDFNSTKLEKTLDQLARELKVSIDSHRLELSGLCSSCSQIKKS
jgi:Fe2+ or Zn2+ uptake regulation protein